MAKKKNQNNNNEKEKENVNDDGCGGGKKQKASGVTMVVLKMDLHCEGCAGRVVKAVRTLDGVESVRIGDSELNKITVIGNIDPGKLRQKVEEKTKKKVELVSPATKNTKDGDNAGEPGDNKKQQKQPQQQAKKEEKKPKEIPVTTAVLKVPLHCQGCVRRIHKLVSKTKGYMEMSIDKNKDLVTVKGGMDMKLLVEALQQKLKRGVEIVQSPQKKDGNGGEKKGKGNGNGNGNGDGDEGEGEGKGEKKKKKEEGGKREAMKMENYGAPVVFPYPQYVYGSGYADYVHAPQLFSDENPNACNLM